MSRKRKALSLDMKMEMLRAVDGGMRKKDVAEKYGIPANSLSTILKARENIENSFYEQAMCGSRKKLRKCSFPDVEEALLAWFKDLRARNLPVSGALLQKKAMDLAFLLGHKEEDFSASSGWLHRFKARHEITCHVASGESSAVDRDSCEKWMEKVAPLLQEYDEKDIYNADETGLFFKLLPERSLAVKGETCHGGKRSKDRLTVLCAANMDGSDKRKLVVIGKSKNPRCFKGIQRLPVEYYANKKAWVTSQLFEQWVIAFDRDMQRQRRQVLLLLDNCAAHKIATQLRAVRLLFLPPNATSLLQPLDQGIIWSLKSLYRKRLVSRLVFDMDQKRVPTAITVRTAIEMLYGAWNDVTAATVKNCFVKAGFARDLPTTQEEANLEQPEMDAWRRLHVEDVTFDDFVSADDAVMVAPELTDDDIVAGVGTNGVDTGSDDDGGDDDDGAHESLQPPHVRSEEALNMVHALKDFVLAHPTASSEAVCEAYRCADRIGEFILAHSSATKQQKITDFFAV
ncbi:tigger transposable element-derived protein 6-like [Ornithodoros turicata]|uniref:tigger transposable element-derived protein 6-like n=1 Tax=Ornithodoros turicata TaxID=34597 RepID=UPI003138BDE9